MKRSRFTESQIVEILKEADGGQAAPYDAGDVRREMPRLPGRIDTQNA
jgi:hypothetical protein